MIQSLRPRFDQTIWKNSLVLWLRWRRRRGSGSADGCSRYFFYEFAIGWMEEGKKEGSLVEEEVEGVHFY